VREESINTAPPTDLTTHGDVESNPGPWDTLRRQLDNFAIRTTG